MREFSEIGYRDNPLLRANFDGPSHMKPAGFLAYREVVISWEMLDFRESAVYPEQNIIKPRWALAPEVRFSVLSANKRLIRSEISQKLICMGLKGPFKNALQPDGSA